MTPAGPVDWTLEIPAPTAGRPELPLFWARRVIQSFEALENAGIAGSSNSRRCIELSKQFGLLCHQTSYIAIEHRSPEERNNGCPATRRIPVLIPSGWHGLDLSGFAPTGLTCGSRARSLSEANVLAACESYDVGEPAGMIKQFTSRIRSFMHGTIARDLAATPSAPSALSILLQQQQADGSFDGSTTVEWKRACKLADTWVQGLSWNGSAALHDRVVFTIAALVLLNRDFAGEQAIWKRAAEKACRYLGKTLAISQKILRAEIERLARST
jgi:hypothetical protein